MTMIIDPAFFASKAKLQERLNSAAGVPITEPSIMGSWRKNSGELPVGFSGVVTNHPLRTKFAEIRKTDAGWRVK